MLFRIIISLILFAVVLTLSALTELHPALKGLLFAAVYAVIGYDVVWRAVRNIFRGQLFDENFLMTVATVGAFFISEYLEAVAVMIFYQVGELFQSVAVGRARRSVSNLMELRPDTAIRIGEDGSETQVLPEEIEAGDLLLLRPGDRAAADGIIEEGSTSVDTSSLTGESVPRDLSTGDLILSGSVNLTAAVKLRAQKGYGQSTAARILDLVENASAKKARSESFITRFARWYTPAVCAAALLVAVLPLLITGRWSEWYTWVYRALTFLVVSCPCALVISVPLSFFGGIGGASKAGVLIKGGSGLELLAKADTFVFDKTGTLTVGSFSVTGVYPEEKKEEIIAAALIAESRSTHPIARCVCSLGEADCSGWEITEQAGHGVRAERNGSVILAGNQKLMESEGISCPATSDIGSTVFVAKNGELLGRITVADTLKDNAVGVIDSLRRSGCSTVMLTGDGEAAASAVARELGIDRYEAGLLPADKVGFLERLLEKRDLKKDCIAFVGDGINDAPVLMRADVGIAMGGIGSDAAIEAADVVLMRDELTSVLLARKVASKTMRIVKQNIVFALGVKLGVLLLTGVGLISGMWLAVFADVGVAVLAILNAVRAMRLPKLQ